MRKNEIGGRFRALAMGLVCLFLTVEVHAKGYKEACHDLARAMAKTMAKKMPGKIVIAPTDLVDLDSSKTKLGRFLIESIVDEFVRMDNADITVVDRANIRRILDEHKLVEQGLVDQTAAIKLGEFSEANLVLVGRVQALDDAIVMKVRALSTHKEEIVASGEESFDRTEDLDKLASGYVVEDGTKGRLKEKPREVAGTGADLPQKMPKSYFSVGPEIGGHWYEASRLNFESQASSYVTLLKSNGWYSATEKHSVEARSMYYGVLAQYTRGWGVVGVGFRYFDLGSGSIVVEDQHYPQWTKLTDSVQQSFTSPYISVGCTNGIWSLNGELGTTSLNWEENYAWSGYGSSNTYFDLRRNLKATSSGMWYALAGAADLRFSRNFSLNLSLGYKVNRFESFVLNSVESNFSGYRVGDTLKSGSNENYKVNLDSAFGNMKLLFVF